MRVNFRQGIVGHQSGFLSINPSGNVDILTVNRPVILTIAHVNTNYTYSENNDITNAWFGPFLPSENYWLYWDFNLLTFERTFGVTTLEPIAQSVEPNLGTDVFGEPYRQPGRHWYDTANNRHFVWQGSFWSEVIRIFAAQITNGNVFIPQSITSGSFVGTQIGNTNSVRSGRVLFDEASDPIRRDNGTFFTTEDQFFSSASRVDALRLESNVARAQFPYESAVAAFTPIAWKDEGKAQTAQYDDIGTTVVGMLTEDVLINEVGAVIIQGVVTNIDWDWLSGPNAVDVGDPLWIENGSLVPYDPHVLDAVTYPKGRVPVARVLDRDTVVFEQGLGGKGDRGPTGSIEDIPPATISELGGGILSVAPTNPDFPILVENNDPRLSDARTPLPHTHEADEVNFTPGAGIISNNVEGALLELGTEKLNKSGGTMTGFLTLHSNPTSSFHATTKQYVDGLVSGLIWLDPICTLNLISDEESTPPVSPFLGDSYIIPPGATGAWSSFAAGHVVTWDGTTWIDRGAVTSFAASGDIRFGVAFTSTTSPSGTNLSGNKDKIALYDATTGNFNGFATVNGSGPVPAGNQAVFVCGDSDVFAFYQFAYSDSQSKWINVGATSALVAGDNLEQSGSDLNVINQYVDGAATSLDADLWKGQDITITSIQDQQILTYDAGSSSWINSTPSTGSGSSIEDVDSDTFIKVDDNPTSDTDTITATIGLTSNHTFTAGDGTHAVVIAESGCYLVTPSGTSGQAGVDLTIESGRSGSYDDGGAINITTGVGYYQGSGGAINITGGKAGGTFFGGSFYGGAINITGGAGSYYATGGTVTIQGGDGDPTGYYGPGPYDTSGGGVVIGSGKAYRGSGTVGDITVTVGVAHDGATAGTFEITGGNVVDTGTSAPPAGAINITGGEGGDYGVHDGDGGSITLAGGPGAGEGGDVTIRGGYARGYDSTDANGGSIILQGGGAYDDGENIPTTGSVIIDNSSQTDLPVNLQFRDGTASVSNFVGFKAPADISTGTTGDGSPVVWVLPEGDGTSGQVLSTNGSGILEWKTTELPVPYEIPFFIAGSIVINVIGGSRLITRDVFIPDTLGTPSANQSLAVAEVAPTNPVTLDILLNGSTVGTIAFPSGNTNGTFSISSPLNLSAGDKIQIQMPSSSDPSMEDITITIVGCATAATCSTS